MKKNLIKIYMLGLGIFAFLGLSFVNAKMEYTGKRASNPMDTLTNMVSDANDGHYKIQNTAFDGVSDREGNYSSSYKVTNTLEYFRKNMDPYLQWAIYIGLVAATIAFIYMGFLMVTNGINGGVGTWAKLKNKFFHVLIGIILLTGTYAIIKLIVALINLVFG